MQDAHINPTHGMNTTTRGSRGRRFIESPETDFDDQEVAAIVKAMILAEPTVPTEIIQNPTPLHGLRFWMGKPNGGLITDDDVEYPCFGCSQVVANTKFYAFYTTDLNCVKQFLQSQWWTDSLGAALGAGFRSVILQIRFCERCRYSRAVCFRGLFRDLEWIDPDEILGYCGGGCGRLFRRGSTQIFYRTAGTLQFICLGCCEKNDLKVQRTDIE